MKKIFVGNFAFNMTEGQLRSLFEPFGTIESVSLVTDRDTGRVRGFGFVEMPNNAEAEKAIAALNGTDVGGRTINVNEARPKTERSNLRGSGRDRYHGHSR
jgi:RNA recognition motif-containing protein